jgi:hypothetical protein
MCAKLVTLIFRDGVAFDSTGERKGCAGEPWAGVEPDDGTVRGCVAEGVGCCDCGRKRGLEGGSGCWLEACGLASEGLCCCECWAGVELDGGAPASAIGTSATARGGAFADDEGRPGCVEGDSCVCWCPPLPPNMGL